MADTNEPPIPEFVSEEATFNEPQGTEADFELYEVVEESASKINAGDVGGNTTHDDDYAEDEAEEDEAVEDEEVEDEEVEDEDEEVEDEADCEDQNETYIIENKKEQPEESDVGDEEEPDEELVIEQESQSLFYHAGRFTWTGEAASNAKHGKETHKAQGLLCVQALVG
ncbi:histone chaperone ASF1-like [Culex quinquefasciatus]|uniref:histone chaperone ASF1-like n=1 Tax=Culex quinquefasciatus TaxID=7176 RepID=UPI0018E356AB|nr:histone chaperone ASF1-like [Culex quinquefasciatus]